MKCMWMELAEETVKLMLLVVGVCIFLIEMADLM